MVYCIPHENKETQFSYKTVSFGEFPENHPSTVPCKLNLYQFRY